MVEVAVFNVQRAITPKVCNPELWFMRSACHHIVLNICMNFNISDGFQVGFFMSSKGTSHLCNVS